MKQFRHVILLVLAAISGLAFGQKGVSPGQFYKSQQETTAARFRRLLAKADIQNALTNPTLVGSVPWAASTAYTVGNVVSNGGNAYICMAGGTSSGSGGPSGRSVGQTDNAVTWDYIGPQTAPQVTLQASVPTYISSANEVTLNYNDPRVRVLGCANPLDNGNGWFFPVVNGGLGAKGNGVPYGSVAGSPLVNGFQQDHFGTQICTDAPVVVFQTSNSGYDANFIVEQSGRKQYVSPTPFVGTTGSTNYWVLDFTKTGNVSSTNGPQIPPGSGATFTAVLTGSSITSVTVNSGGSGYSQSNLPTLIAYGNCTFVANLIPVVNSSGQITSVTVQYGGSYSSTPTVIAQSGRAKRILTMECGETMRIANVYVGAMDTVWPIPTQDRIRAACFGDSWVEGFTQSDPSRRLGQAECFCHLMGWDDCIASGEGGCGWTVPDVPIEASTTVTSGAFAGGSQTVTLSAVTATNGGGTNYNFMPGMFLTFDTGASRERVQVTAVSIGSSTVTATFANSHPANCVVSGYVNKNQTSTTVTSGAIAGSGTGQTITVASLLTPTGAIGISNGNSIVVDPTGANPDVVTITALSGSNITAVIPHSHAAGCIVLGVAQTFNASFAERITDIAFPDSATFKNKTGDTGNGTCSAITIGSARVPGNYTFTATSATTFTAVDGTGAPLPDLTVGTVYSAGGLQFTITAGGTAYVSGDVFTIYVVTKPDIIVFPPNGINDASASASAAVIQSEVTKAYTQIRSILPTTPIIWFGCQGLQNSTSLAVENGVAAALTTGTASLDPNLLYCTVQNDSPLWLVSNNNKGYYINPALGHPTDQGYLFQAQHMQNALVRNFIATAIWP